MVAKDFLTVEVIYLQTEPGSASAPTGKESDLVKEAGIRRYFLNVNGDNRTFLVQLPKDYDPSKNYPVIFFFHFLFEAGIQVG